LESNAGIVAARSVGSDGASTRRPRARAFSTAQDSCRRTIAIRQLSGDDNVTKTNSSWTLAVAAAVGICALAGCNQRESAAETAKDVADERQDAQENVAEERREAAQVATEGAEDRAAAEYDVAVAQADGQRNIAKEKCETLSSDAQKACKDQAEATYESAKAQAQATLDAAKRSGSADPAPMN
jgi:hypothetical protein